MILCAISRASTRTAAVVGPPARRRQSSSDRWWPTAHPPSCEAEQQLALCRYVPRGVVADARLAAEAAPWPFAPRGRGGVVPQAPAGQVGVARWRVGQQPDDETNEHQGNCTLFHTPGSFWPLWPRTPHSEMAQVAPRDSPPQPPPETRWRNKEALLAPVLATAGGSRRSRMTAGRPQRSRWPSVRACRRSPAVAVTPAWSSRPRMGGPASRQWGHHPELSEE